ncbi:hypothetical protein EB06_01161 [Enterococcus cecorum]|uniref:BppU family phage baseplate upper protein n=1 Tax=Enterococcus cecorum TaxID=44008 RepID=UPI000DEB916A|nr:BppU family phage baseplate upper protein [Enterococcus cecorum]RBR32278.1 hypothetical protein EB06_01161 [Enterococcus cecorum]
MDYYKKIERSITISADRRSTVDLQADVWSQDLNVTKFILKLDTTDSTAIDLTNATVRVVMVYSQDGTDVKIEAAGIVEDVVTQKIAYIMDDKLAGFEGTVIAGFYVTLSTGQRIDIQNVTFNMRKSLLDKDLEAAKESYYQTFDDIVADINGYADSQKQIIRNTVIDVQSTGDKAKNDINAVLPTVQTQVSDLKTEIENLPDIPEVYTDLAEIKSYIGYTDTDIYGVEIDMTNRRFKRLSGAIGKNGGTDFDNINAYKRRRCILTNDGTVLAYYGESNYTESGATTAEIVKNGTTYPIGTPVQVMVEQPKFYYKVVPLALEPTANGKGYHMRKGRYYISDYPKSGFKVHPAFIRNGVEHEKIYLSAYEGSIYDKSASAYLLNDEQAADFSADLLSSIANAKPCSGLTQNLTRANVRLLAHNRGNGWEQQTVQTVSLTQLLFLIEYAKFNMQDVLGPGATGKTDDSTSNLAEPTGATTTLGNQSGHVTNGNNIQIFSYRGEENLYGNIWKFIDGINVMANGIHAAYVADHDFNDKQSTGSYTDVGFTFAKTSGYVSAFGYSQEFDWLFLTSETTGNSSVPVGDYFWQNYTATDDGGWRTVQLGAYWNGGSGAGGFYWIVGSPSVHRNRNLSGRLVYLGG